ncbi:MAG: insulinase family protein, partial [Desulfovibrionaceae bacterium]|nr:insulinase family protein [Desulfovibrionaceae bacterium]
KYKYDNQLVDSISVGNMSLARAGLLVLTAQLEARKAEPFWQELTRDMAALKGLGFSPEALERARFNLQDSMDRAGETLNGLVGWRGMVQMELGGEQGERNLRLALDDVTLEQVRAAVGQWFVSERARVRVLAPQGVELPDFGKILAANWPALPVADNSAQGDGAQGQREVLTLGQGRTLILLPDDTVPYVSMELMFPGGSALLEPQQQGLASLTARLLADGYGTLDRHGVERFFAERAASVAAEAGMQNFGISLTGPARFNADYFAALGQMLWSPAFDAQELEREVEQMKAAIRQRADRPLAYAFARLRPFLYPGGQPYGFDSLGSPESLGKFDREDVSTFWGRQLHQPWVLAVAGSFDREAVLAFAKSLPQPASAGLTVAEPHWGQEKALELRLPGRNQAHLMQVFRTVPADHPDAPALMLLQAILSGQSGILFSSLRDEQGLGYTVTAFNRLMPETGFMAFYIGTTPDRLAQAREGFAKVIAQIKADPLPEASLRAGANRLLGEYARDRQSLASRAGEAASDAVLHLPQDFLKGQIDKAATLTPADVQAVARKYLVQDGAYELTLMP